MSELLERGRRGEPLTGIEAVDMHGHLGVPPFGIGDVSADSCVAVMDRLGMRTIVISHIHCLSAGASVGNDEILAAARAHPGRILGYVRLWPQSAEAVRADAERYLAEEAFVGVKLHNVTGFAYTDPAYEPALAMADAMHMPVLLHTWGRAEEMAEVDELAARYRNVALVLAHAGVQGRVNDYARLVRAHENVWLDLAMSLVPRGHVERLVEAAGIGRVVWGSDATFLSMSHQLGKVLGARLTDDQKRTILADNPRRILERIQR